MARFRCCVCQPIHANSPSCTDKHLLCGRDALIVAAAGRPDWRRLAEPHFRHIEPGEDVPIRRAGQAALSLHTAHGYGLR